MKWIWSWTSKEKRVEILEERKEKKREYWRKLIEIDNKRSRKVKMFCEAFLHKQLGLEDFKFEFKINAWHAWKMGYEVNTAFTVEIKHDSMIAYFKGDKWDWEKDPHIRVSKIVKDMFEELGLKQRGMGSSMGGIQKGWMYKDHHVKFGAKGGCYYINSNHKKEYVKKKDCVLHYEDEVMDCFMREFTSNDEKTYYRWQDNKRVIPQQELDKLK